ncbi:MAG: TonB-dependent receptor domain-containing protein [Cellvibrionaceae bacterium]
MKKLFLLSSLIGGVLVLPSAYTEEELNTIVITGSRTGLDVVNNVSSYIVTQAEIEASTADDVPQLLAQIPGVSIEDRGGRGATASVRIRGTESDHVLVLIDGVRSASATSGTTSLQFLPLDQIDRIEVVKGPQSGIYGAEAIGGVIQIFTKSGKNTQGGHANISYGSNDTGVLGLGYSGANDYVHYGINVGYEGTDGIDRTVENIGLDRDDDEYDQRNISLNIGHQALKGPSVNFQYLLTEGSTEFDGLGGTFDQSTDFKSEAFTTTFDLPVTSSIKLNLDLGYFSDDQQTFSDNPSIFNTERDSLTTYIDYQIKTGQSLVLGYDYYNDRVESTQTFVETQRNNNAVFAEYAINRSDFSVQLAYRQDDNEAFGTQKSGNAAITVPINAYHQIGLSYGTGFKAPTFNDLYFPFTDFGFGFTYEGNPDLEPEKSRSRELSYTAKFNHFRFLATIYKTEIENLIESTDSFDTVENISETELRGGELAIDTTISGVKAGLALSYVDAENKTTKERLTRRPRSTARLSLDKSFDKLNIGLVLFAEGNRKQSSTLETAGYGIVDFKVLYDLTRQSSIKFQVKNVFDKEYTLVQSSSQQFNTPGSTAELTYKYKF